MDIMDALRDYKKKLDEINKIKATILTAVKAAIKDNKPIDGVKPLDNNGLCFTVDFSTLCQSKIWSAEYYSNEKQIDEVMNYLFCEPKNRQVLAVETVASRIDKICKQKYIKRNCGNFYLNSNMLKTLEKLRGYLV